jgi:hypothetical protein
MSKHPNLDAAMEWLAFRVPNCTHSAVLLSHLRHLLVMEGRYEAVKDSIVGMKWADVPFDRPNGSEDEKYVTRAGFDYMASALQDIRNRSEQLNGEGE